MANPWNTIGLEDYEEHMASPEVGQLQLLNEITSEQLMDNPHPVVAVLGVAGGNGLEHINPSETQMVYAIDINKDYLTTCEKRYSRPGYALKTLCLDLNSDDAELPPTSLLICNLIVEYLSERKFVSLINRNRQQIIAVSCVIQQNNTNTFISNSGLTTRLSSLLTLHYTIDAFKLKELFKDIRFTLIKEKVYGLPNGKNFIRLDFNNNDSLPGSDYFMQASHE